MTTGLTIAFAVLIAAVVMTLLAANEQSSNAKAMEVEIEHLKEALKKDREKFKATAHELWFLRGVCQSADHRWEVAEAKHGVWVHFCERDYDGTEYRFFAKYFHADTPEDLSYARNCAEELCDKLNEKI